LNKTFKSLSTFKMRRRLDITPSFAMATFADETPTASRDPSAHGGNQAYDDQMAATRGANNV
jgi:hypothetical protein